MHISHMLRIILQFLYRLLFSLLVVLIGYYQIMMHNVFQDMHLTLQQVDFNKRCRTREASIVLLKQTCSTHLGRVLLHRPPEYINDRLYPQILRYVPYRNV